ncbi:MAG: PDZ domain-containing protein, partial [Nannocystaceae bacterium]
FERGEYGPHFATLDVPRGVERAELTLYLVRNRLPPKTPPVDFGYSYAGPMFCDGNEVGTVQDGGLAQQAGLRVGDEIVAIDGHDVSDSRCYLRDWLLRVPPGRAVELTLARGDVLQLGTSAP